ncbi:polymerase delta-interacting protein 3 isoform X2 [Lingula anatina]|uniref:Polymerase delta-interacting protein 3 isoform X2 n=1 Tax=Lingula anatina TaxID=7574 RepID=A0A2R2MT50_LINAN|nr:polymerase delta-interacting protein 3 isoform X2 [Lingula anatina]|eukprot:XP_023933431.1 polymerase delta-interacting protein 3 isoform X2 [Lingula anatina]
MDVSLDDYITKNQRKFVSRPGASAQQRLGAKTKGPVFTTKQQGNIKQRPGIQRQTKFAVTGLGNVKGFDARQKIASKPIKDARDKIIAKTKFVDARVRIQNKKAQQPVDAREKLKAKQANKGPTVSVTGLGNFSKQQTQPKQGINQNFTVTSLQTTGGLVRAIGNPGQKTSGHQVLMGSNNIFVTTSNKPTTAQPLGAVRTNTAAMAARRHPHSLPARSPIIQIRNDQYEEPDPDSDPEMEYTYTPPPVRVTGPAVKVPSPVISQTRSPIRLTAKTTPKPVQQVKVKTLQEPEVDVISPLQGYKILVTNLHPVVTEEDIIELFSAMGALKKARMLKPGVAEAVFFKKEEAVLAIKKYHNRELDGVPMQVKMVTPLTAVVSKPPEDPEVSSSQHVFGRLGPASSKEPQNQGDVDVSLVHKALFKAKDAAAAPSRPVTFTVKI